jgi:hypothetical protein
MAKSTTSSRMDSVNGDARNDESAPRIGCRKLEARCVHPKPPRSYPRRKAVEANTLASAHYTGSQACQKCHADIYEHWKKTPMANVVRDPKEHPDSIIPNLSTNKVSKFTKDQVALVYGSIWKQRYFTKVGDDYYPLPVQWDIHNKKWLKYHVPDTGADWWGPSILRTTCNDRQDQPAMAATLSTMTFTPSRSRSGMLAANAVTVPAVNTSPIPHEPTSSIRRRWTT